MREARTGHWPQEVLSEWEMSPTCMSSYSMVAVLCSTCAPGSESVFPDRPGNTLSPLAAGDQGPSQRVWTWFFRGWGHPAGCHSPEAWGGERCGSSRGLLQKGNSTAQLKARTNPGVRSNSAVTLSSCGQSLLRVSINLAPRTQHTFLGLEMKALSLVSGSCQEEGTGLPRRQCQQEAGVRPVAGQLCWAAARGDTRQTISMTVVICFHGSERWTGASFGAEMASRPQWDSVWCSRVSVGAYRISKDLNPFILYLKRVK